MPRMARSRRGCAGCHPSCSPANPAGPSRLSSARGTNLVPEVMEGPESFRPLPVSTSHADDFVSKERDKPREEGNGVGKSRLVSRRCPFEPWLLSQPDKVERRREEQPVVSLDVLDITWTNRGRQAFFRNSIRLALVPGAGRSKGEKDSRARRPARRGPRSRRAPRSSPRRRPTRACLRPPASRAA